MAGGGEFNRERFLLKAVVGVFVAQFSIYVLAIGGCIYQGQQQRPDCADMTSNLRDSFEAALGTALALLGGGSLMARQGKRNSSSNGNGNGNGSS
ncbi:MAG: hypothetical protein ERJ67_10195 [Aphanocapsa feldmannii 277cV]|uniref:Uncharacterized protein n=1 Tax=Aphanocapsa feldmannii 277cV TaxID=2507553 RepID=A0A524RL53_9CHRO|nr:MAG: hypothetical protein ERJ67_10195 [Aphanocapsa feldmannii 277cV]